MPFLSAALAFVERRGGAEKDLKGNTGSKQEVRRRLLNNPRKEHVSHFQCLLVGGRTTRLCICLYFSVYSKSFSTQNMYVFGNKKANYICLFGKPVSDKS